MNHLMGLLFRGPFWVQLALAAGLVWVGLWVQGDLAKTAEARAALLAQAPPATVPITAAMGKAGSAAEPVEVSVSAEIALAESIRLVRKTNGVTTGETLLYVLYAPGAPEGTKLAQAAVLIDPDDLDAFVAWAGDQSTGLGLHGPVATIAGLKVSPSESGHAAKAMTENGLTFAEGFFYIEPFLRGREAGLTVAPPGRKALYFFFGMAALFALIAGKKVLARRRAVAVAPPAAEHAPVLADVPAPEADAPQTAAAELPDFGANPIAALKAREAARQAPPAPAAAEAPAAGKAAKPRKPRSLARMALPGLLLVFVAAAVTGSWQVFSLLPLLVMGYVYVMVRKGGRALGRAANALVDRQLDREEADRPQPAAVPPRAPAPRERDGFEAGPIRTSAGFSLKALVPQRKPKAPEGPDPFDRLTAMVAAERRREAMLRMSPAE